MSMPALREGPPASNDYQYWKSMLAFNAQEVTSGKWPDFDKRYPEAGFYRHKNTAIAIWWRDGGQCLARTTTVLKTGEVKIRDYDKADVIGENVFAYCCRKPITRDQYRAFEKTGSWPEDIGAIGPKGAPPSGETPLEPADGRGTNREPARREGSREYAAEDRADARLADEVRGLPGDNLPSEPDKAIEAELDDLLERAAAFVRSIDSTVTNKQDADIVSNYGVAVADLEKRAEATRVAEKEPHLEAGRAVDAKWGGLIARAKTAKTNLKSLLTRWLSIQKAAAQAEAAAEEQRRQRDREEGRPVMPRRAQPSSSVAGTTGRVSLHTRIIYEISDIRALTTYLVGLDPLPADWLEVSRRAGARLMEQGVKVPGMTAREEESVV
jgi:hypothetical protein